MDPRAKHAQDKRRLLQKFGEEIDAYAALIAKQVYLESQSLGRPAWGLTAAEKAASAKRKLIMEALENLL